MKKIIRSLANLPTFVQIISNIILLGVFSCVLIFIENDVIKVILVMVLFAFISILFMAMNQGYSIKYKKKMMKKMETITIEKDFSEFKYYLSQNGYTLKKEDSSLLTYSIINDDIRLNISFVDNFERYLSYLASIKKEDNLNEAENKKEEDNVDSNKKIKMAVFVIIFKESNDKIKEYCYNHCFTVEKFGLLFYFYEDNTLNTYYSNCKNQEILDQFNKVVGEINGN